MTKIAIVDDDLSILDALSVAFKAADYDVECYSNGAAALKAFEEEEPDVAIFDVKMPRMDGLELLDNVRKTSDFPVIYLTSKDSELDEIFGLKMGADDFITKPFSLKVVIERVSTVLRRARIRRSKLNDKHAPVGDTIEFGDLYMDLERYETAWKGQAVTLTATEFSLMRTLMSRPGMVHDRESLAHSVGGQDYDFNDRVIDSHIKRLRQKYKQVDPEFDLIETLYGLGYRSRV